VKGRLVEAIGVQPDRTQVKRRKAWRAGEPAGSGEARNPSGSPLSIGDEAVAKSVDLIRGVLSGSAQEER